MSSLPLLPSVPAPRAPTPSSAAPHHDAVAAILAELVRTELDVDLPGPDDDLRATFDSLELMTLMVAVEDRFLIRLDPDQEARITTARDLIELIVEVSDEVVLADSASPS